MNSSARDISEYRYFASWSGKEVRMFVYHSLSVNMQGSGDWYIESSLYRDPIGIFAGKKKAMEFLKKEYPEAKFVAHYVK